MVLEAQVIMSKQVYSYVVVLAQSLSTIRDLYPWWWWWGGGVVGTKCKKTDLRTLQRVYPEVWRQPGAGGVGGYQCRL